MSEHELIEYCSPTLAAIKTGNLFTVAYEDRKELTKEICALNARFRKKGLRVILLGFTRRRARIYIYRPSFLQKDMQDREAAQILTEMGYQPENSDLCVARLAAKLRKCAAREEFPHEIGLFLGYPPADVRGFMEHRDSKYTGCWKVYDNVEEAMRRFARFHRCEEIYGERFKRGESLDRLVVGA